MFVVPVVPDIMRVVLDEIQLDSLLPNWVEIQ